MALISKEKKTSTRKAPFSIQGWQTRLIFPHLSLWFVWNINFRRRPDLYISPKNTNTLHHGLSTLTAWVEIQKQLHIADARITLKLMPTLNVLILVFLLAFYNFFTHVHASLIFGFMVVPFNFNGFRAKKIYNVVNVYLCFGCVLDLLEFEVLKTKTAVIPNIKISEIGCKVLLEQSTLV